MQSEPPRKLSIEKASPHYDKQVLDRGVEVYLDGIRQVANVIEYDLDTGELTRYRKTALGKVITDKFHQAQKETKRGVIRVEWKG